jgi:hypothetical protein
MKAIDFAVLIGCGLLLASCGGPDEPVESPTPVVTESSVWFSEEGQDRGVDFQLDVRETGRFAIPEIMTGGIAMFDMEGDGDLDLYMVQTGPLADIDRSGELPTNRLYENIGEGRYSDATAESGADDDGYGVGVAAGDFDGDGHVDLWS